MSPIRKGLEGQCTRTQRRLEEEMRLLYVAVTRAKNLVIFLDRDKARPMLMTSPRYTWEDELLHARAALRA